MATSSPVITSPKGANLTGTFCTLGNFGTFGTFGYLQPTDDLSKGGKSQLVQPAVVAVVYEQLAMAMINSNFQMIMIAGIYVSILPFSQIPRVISQ